MSKSNKIKNNSINLLLKEFCRKQTEELTPGHRNTVLQKKQEKRYIESLRSKWMIYLQIKYKYKGHVQETI